MTVILTPAQKRALLERRGRYSTRHARGVERQR